MGLSTSESNTPEHFRHFGHQPIGKTVPLSVKMSWILTPWVRRLAQSHRNISKRKLLFKTHAFDCIFCIHIWWFPLRPCHISTIGKSGNVVKKAFRRIRLFLAPNTILLFHCFPTGAINWHWLEVWWNHRICPSEVFVVWTTCCAHHVRVCIFVMVLSRFWIVQHHRSWWFYHTPLVVSPECIVALWTMRILKSTFPT